MLMTKIKIKNFKGLKDITIDLKSNISQSKKDILSGSFKKTSDGKHIVPAFAAIFGRNGIGKTSIFEAIGLFVHFDNGAFQKMAIMKLQTELANENFQIPQTPMNNIDFFIQETKPNGTLYERYNVVQRTLINDTFEFVSNNKEKNIELELWFDIEKTDVQVKWTLFNQNVTKKISNDNYQLEIDEYIRNIHAPSIVHAYKGQIAISSLDNAEDKTRFLVSTALPLIREKFGAKKLDELISLADPKITKIIWISNRGKEFPESVMTANGPLSFLSLSTGTVQLLWLSFRILMSASRKKPSLILIDEIELSLHQELIETLKMMMVDAFSNYNIQSLFTTHSPLAVTKGTSYKQIFSMDEVEDGIVMRKMSADLKPAQSIIKNYQRGFFSAYPDKEKARNFVAALFCGEDE